MSLTISDPSAMQCAGSANNPLIRAEDYTALAGDIFITCQGGIPTAVGTPIPKATITIFVTNTTITSKLTQTTDDPNWNEALLIVDEAGSTTGGNGLLNCGSATAPFETTPNDLTCNITSANGDGTGDYTGTAGRPNVFQGRVVDGSFGQAIQFVGVPIDRPGNTPIAPGGFLPTRTMRITNLRVNAVALNVFLGNSFSLTRINTTVSVNGSSFGGNQIMTVQNGTVFPGLVVSPSTAQVDRLTGAATFLQCNAVAGYTTNSILLSEGFAAAFKVRNFAQIIANGSAPATPGAFFQWNGGSGITSPDVNQNVPNALYNTETGINFDPLLASPATNPPAGTSSNGTAPAGTAFNTPTTGISTAGEVSQGTRFAIRFAGIPAGSNPSVPLTVPLQRGTLAIVTGTLVMVCGTDSHGYGGTTAACTTPAGTIAGTSPIALDANGNGMVVYEVAFADPNALEFANVVVYVNPTINLNANPPVGGTPQVGVTGTANASFAPFYATSTAGVGAAQVLSATYPIPRFVDNPLPNPPVNLYSYSACPSTVLPLPLPPPLPPSSLCNPSTLTFGTGGFVDTFQVHYISNLNIGDSYVNMTNTGTSSTTAFPNQNGNICANVFTFSPDEQLVSCCSCLVTPDALVSLSARNDLINNTLTPAVPTSLVVKVVASAANVGAAGPLVGGLSAWGNTLHATPATGSTLGTYATIETPFARGTLSGAEFTRITTLCGFIQSNGSGFGICNSCRLGGLGSVAP